MIRKLTTLAFAILIFPFSAAAQSSGPQSSTLYVAGAVGHSTFWDVDDTEFDLLAFFISGAVGYRVTPNLRAEAEWLFESADFDDSSAEIEVIRGTISGYYDLSPTSLIGFSNLTPYVGGGLGVANVDVIDDDNEFTLHGEVGFNVALTNQLEFVPGFRLEYTTLDDADDDLWITQLRAGLRYNF
jgi:opacity protein-like surface antigen